MSFFFSFRFFVHIFFSGFSPSYSVFAWFSFSLEGWKETTPVDLASSFLSSTRTPDTSHRVSLNRARAHAQTHTHTHVHTTHPCTRWERQTHTGTPQLSLPLHPGFDYYYSGCCFHFRWCLMAPKTEHSHLCTDSYLEPSPAATTRPCQSPSIRNLLAVNLGK